MSVKAYTKLSFGYRLPNGDFKTFFVGEDVSGSNLKPWSVFVQYDFEPPIYQICKWYSYRGWAEKAIKKLKNQYQEDYQ